MKHQGIGLRGVIFIIFGQKVCKISFTTFSESLSEQINRTENTVHFGPLCDPCWMSIQKTFHNALPHSIIEMWYPLLNRTIDCCICDSFNSRTVQQLRSFTKELDLDPPHSLPTSTCAPRATPSISSFSALQSSYPHPHPPPPPPTPASMRQWLYSLRWAAQPPAFASAQRPASPAPRRAHPRSSHTSLAHATSGSGATPCLELHTLERASMHQPATGGMTGMDRAAARQNMSGACKEWGTLIHSIEIYSFYRDL